MNGNCMRHLSANFASQIKDPHFRQVLLFGLLIGGLFWLNAPRAWLTFQVVSPLHLFKLMFLNPLFEEIVFRGMIQGELLKKVSFRRSVGGISLSNVITSLMFAGVHSLNQPLVLASLIFVPSLLLGYFRERHSGLITPIVLHVYFNGIYILFCWFALLSGYTATA